MCMDLAGPLAPKGEARVALTFGRAGEFTLTMPVLARNATGTDHDEHGAMDHGSHAVGE